MLWISQRLYTKKLETTKRNFNVEYKYTNGGSGIVLRADAVTFEPLRLATLNYFEKLTENAKQSKYIFWDHLNYQVFTT
jgi:hypothetical protein